MTPTLRAILDQIDTFLMTDEGGKLADVLSALRGPDSQDIELKQRTTCHIRRAAFPKSVQHHESNDAGGDYDWTGTAMRTKWSIDTDGAPFDTAHEEGGSFHFTSHTREAGYILGLVSIND